MAAAFAVTFEAPTTASLPAPPARGCAQHPPCCLSAQRPAWRWGGAPTPRAAAFPVPLLQCGSVGGRRGGDMGGGGRSYGEVTFPEPALPRPTAFLLLSAPLLLLHHHYPLFYLSFFPSLFLCLLNQPHWLVRVWSSSIPFAAFKRASAPLCGNARTLFLRGPCWRRTVGNLLDSSHRGPSGGEEKKGRALDVYTEV